MSLPTGKITGEPIADYHGSDAVSHSKLEVYRRRPELYRRMYVEKSVQRALVERIDDGATFYKIGMELCMAPGFFELLGWLRRADKTTAAKTAITTKPRPSS